jgi:hypothetical protein
MAPLGERRLQDCEAFADVLSLAVGDASRQEHHPRLSRQ